MDATTEPAAEREPVVQRLTALDTVRARILLAVEIGALVPGARLGSPEDVAAGLEVAPITARRALESLVDDGVLVRRRGRGGGTFVADEPTRVDEPGVAAYRADTETIRGLVDRRLLMEAGVSALAAVARTDADLDRMGAAVEAGRNATSWAAFHLADRDFHLAVADAAHTDSADAYVAAYTRLTAYFVPYPIEFLHGSNAEHAALLEAVRARDAGTAAAVASAHVGALHRDMFIAGARVDPA